MINTCISEWKYINDIQSFTKTLLLSLKYIRNRQNPFNRYETYVQNSKIAGSWQMTTRRGRGSPVSSSYGSCIENLGFTFLILVFMSVRKIYCSYHL